VDRLLEQTQEDLRKEAEIAAAAEKARANLERQVKELKDKLEDIELGKSTSVQRTVVRLEARIEELQARLAAESTTRATAVKAKRNAEREVADAQLKVDELTKERTVLEEQNRKLESRLKSLRTQMVQTEGKVTEASISTSKLERELIAERERAATLARENERLQARLEAERKESRELEERLQSITGGLAASAVLASSQARTFERTSQPAVAVAPIATRRPPAAAAAADPEPRTASPRVATPQQNSVPPTPRQESVPPTPRRAATEDERVATPSAATPTAAVDADAEEHSVSPAPAAEDAKSPRKAYQTAAVDAEVDTGKQDEAPADEDDVPVDDEAAAYDDVPAEVDVGAD